jgi:hypothetical protein
VRDFGPEYRAFQDVAAPKTLQNTHRNRETFRQFCRIAAQSPDAARGNLLRKRPRDPEEAAVKFGP